MSSDTSTPEAPAFDPEALRRKYREERDKRLRDDGISVNALHPGTLLNTKMVREAYPTSYGEPEEGAEAEIHLATAAELEAVTGAYFDQMTRARADAQAYDAEARRRLWELSARLTGVG